MTTTTIQELLETTVTPGMQDISDALQTLASTSDIANLEGQPLREIALQIGVASMSSNDDILRAQIFAQAVVNTSKGRFQDIYAAWAYINKALGGTVTVVRPYHPLMLVLETDIEPADFGSDLAQTVYETLQNAVANEVNLAGISYTGEEGDGYFRYDSGDAADAYDAGEYVDYYRLT